MVIGGEFGFDNGGRDRRRFSGRRMRDRRVLPDRRVTERRLQVVAVAVDQRGGEDRRRWIERRDGAERRQVEDRRSGSWQGFLAPS